MPTLPDHPAPLPPGFVPHVYAQTWDVPRPRAAVWAWPNDPATFTEGQVPPYRVEFLAEPGGAAPARWRLRPTLALAALGGGAGVALGARR